MRYSILNKKKLLTLICLFLCSTSLYAQEDWHAQLIARWSAITKKYKATIGIGAMLIETGDTASFNNEHAYPMQSVYKFPLAMAVLHDVETGKYTLDKKIHIEKKDLPPTWSPIREKYPQGNIDMTVRDLLYYSVSLSDNNACDLLFRLNGGPKKTDAYLKSIGIADIAIAATEKQMHQKWDVQYTNWCKPMAMVALLNSFYQKRHLSDSSSALLMQLMTESSNSAKRLKGQLPEGTIVAHKTGTSAQHSKSGLIAATNDVGIITLPDGRHLALAIFVSDAMESYDTNEFIIALLANTTFDLFTHP